MMNNSRVKKLNEDFVMVDGVEFGGVDDGDGFGYHFLKEIHLSDIRNQVDACIVENGLDIDDEKVAEISMAILDDICEVDGVFMEGVDLFFAVDIDAIEYYKNISIEIEKAMKKVDEILDNIDNYVVSY